MYVLRQNKANDNKVKDDNFGMNSINKGTKCFWNEIKMLAGNDKHVLASTVNGVCGHTDVSQMWHGYDKGILKASYDTVNKKFVTQQFKCCKTDVQFKCCKTDVLTVSPLD